MRRHRLLVVVASSLVIAGCGGSDGGGGGGEDGGADSTIFDSGHVDAPTDGGLDTGKADTATETSATDSGLGDDTKTADTDAGDTGTADTGLVDSGLVDTTPIDTAPADTGVADTTIDCDGATLCGARCVDTTSDPANCGACGAACPTGATCVSSACTCTAGTLCGATCVDTTSDPTNCGACGAACPTGATCVSSACTCTAGTLCGSTCVDTTSDNANCGACGKVCPTGSSCASGTCTCAVGTLCGSACVDTTTDPANCGACGVACPGATSAPPTASCESSACVATSCKTLLAGAPSEPDGFYTIDPDGPGGNAPFSAYCDMTTGGGGWTLVFVPTTDAYTTRTVDYTVKDATLFGASTDVLLAYRDDAFVLQGDWASFALPANWRLKAPFQYDGVDETITAVITGAAPASTTLRYGYQNFLSTCADAWDTPNDWGRICLLGTKAPFYNGFSSDGAFYGLAPTDDCSDSSQPFDTTVCSTTHRFTLGIR